jgi:hypothetical protein
MGTYFYIMRLYSDCSCLGPCTVTDVGERVLKLGRTMTIQAITNKAINLFFVEVINFEDP